jgi:phospholipase/carboxylesterase
MTFCLTTTTIKPEKNIPIKNAIILLHGYGGDGKNISTLVLNWKRFLPNTIFLCPDGHEICPINPEGFQWFDLTKNDDQYILEQSKKAEQKLHQYINEVKTKYNFKNLQICL